MLTDTIILLVLVLINGVFAASEIAVVSVNRNKVKIAAEHGDKKAARLLLTIEAPSNFLATIQIGISFIGLFSGAYAAQSFTDPIVGALVDAGVTIAPTVIRAVIFLAITIILTFLTLVLGELVPKRLGMEKSAQLAYAVIGPLNILSKLAYPIVKLLSFCTDFTLKLFGIDPKKSDEDITEEEIRMLVESGSEHGSIAESEQAMINNIFDFDNKTAEDACIHRVDVVALPVDAAFDEIIDVFKNEPYSRIPIYEENIDDILGVLHVRDMMKYMTEHDDMTELDLRAMLRPPYFVPFSKKTHELFQEMQKLRVQLAVVVDEYGGTLGIVTMEDLVEEIVGNIFDEHDDVEFPDITQIDETTTRVVGTADLEDVEEYFGVKLPTDEYDTVSGFLVGQLGHIPAEDERPEVEFNGLLFKVEYVSERRVSSAIVLKL